MKRLALLLALLLALPAADQAAATHGSLGHWHSAHRFNLVIQDEIGGQTARRCRRKPRWKRRRCRRRKPPPAVVSWEQGRDAALADYESLGIFDFTVRPSAPQGPCDGGHFPAPGTVRFCAIPTNNEYAGYAYLKYSSTGHISSGVVALDPWLRSPEYARYGVCHEFGHILGLYHRFEPGGESSCMSYNARADRPDAHDREALALAHAHTDTGPPGSFGSEIVVIPDFPPPLGP